MKCIKYVGPRNDPPHDIRRVPDDVAARFVADKNGWWAYCPKSEWKASNKQEG